MKTIMNDSHIKTLEQVHQFLEATAAVELSIDAKEDRSMHSPQKWAPLINDFYRDHFNPYINDHRPCFFPVVITNNQGQQRKHYSYEQMMTPYEKLKSLPQAQPFLKAGLTFKPLDEIAVTLSDNEAAKQLTEAKQRLFNTLTEQDLTAA
jgi:hypothetical protein